MIRAALVAMCLAGPAMAQDLPPNCEKTRGALVNRLDGNISEGGYAEQQLGIWIDTRSGGMVELYGNTQTGTMTLLETKPGGPTCITGAGQGFQQFLPQPQGSPA